MRTFAGRYYGVEMGEHRFQVDRLAVRVHETAQQVAIAAAEMVATSLIEGLERQELIAILLATGNSQIQFLEALTANKSLDWSRIECLHLDELMGISANHPGSFRYYLRERVQKRVHPRAFYYIEGDALSPLPECDRYASLLAAREIFLCCLGVGTNGHLAFNEPVLADLNDPYAVKLVKLAEETRRAQMGDDEFASLDEVPQYAFTLTLPSILAAKKLVCLAIGESKAEVVKQMLEGAIAASCPASFLRTCPDATLFLDTQAARLLEGNS